MKTVIVLCLIVACANGAVVGKQESEKVPQILSSHFDKSPEGKYDFTFESEDGIARSEKAEVKSLKNEEGEDVSYLAIAGQYTYPNSEGQQVQVSYVADENGYQIIDKKNYE